MKVHFTNMRKCSYLAWIMFTLSVKIEALDWRRADGEQDTTVL